MRKLFMSNFGNTSKISCYVIKAKYKTVFMVYEDLYRFVLTLFLKGHRVNCWFWSLSGVDTRWVRGGERNFYVYCFAFFKSLGSMYIVYSKQK